MSQGLRSGMEMEQHHSGEMYKPVTSEPSRKKRHYKSSSKQADKDDRRQARAAAVYYSECYLRGIEPKAADIAAADAKSTYNRWWVKAVNNEGSVALEGGPEAGQKRPLSGCHESEKENSNDNEAMPSSSKKMRLSGDHSTVSALHQETPKTGTVPSAPAAPLAQGIDAIKEAKQRIILHLKNTDGNTDAKEFTDDLAMLTNAYKPSAEEHLKRSTLVNGNWLTLTKPKYYDCKGKNDKGEYMYSLGRIAFDMFKPVNLVCSIKAIFNRIQPIDPKNPGRPLNVPKSLHKEIKNGNAKLRCYDILVAFTIQPDQTKRGTKKEDAEESEYVIPRPIEGILTNQGYAVADPNDKSRLSIWFSNGSLEVLDEANDLEEWKKIFDFEDAPNRNFKEYANILAARILLGANIPESMDADGTMSFSFKRPIGGHGSAYCDVVYLDDDFRIMRGHRGSLFVCTRIPNSI